MNNTEIIYGRNSVLETLKSKHKIYELYIQQGLKVDEIINLARNKSIRIIIKSKNELDRLAGNKHQGVVLNIEKYSYKSVEDMLSKKKSEYPLIVILDGIEDPHNLGSILRTADAAGVDGIIIPKHDSAELNATVAKVSTGAIEHVAVARSNLNMTIDKLKKDGFFIIGTDALSNKKYDEVDYACPVALIIGSEGKGIRESIKKECDLLIKIPMKGHVNSLNAGVAAGILIFEVNRRRESRKN